jgi:hypothetical protein
MITAAHCAAARTPVASSPSKFAQYPVLHMVACQKTEASLIKVKMIGKNQKPAFFFS